jgi:hypothetical protein
METRADSAVTSRSWTSLTILNNGECEPLKAAVHGAALGLCALMGAYNAAAWLRRRQPHLGINAIIYLSAVVWEHRHVVHHLRPCIESRVLRQIAPAPPPASAEAEVAIHDPRAA